MKPEQAWEQHDKDVELRKIYTIKDRLENTSGPENRSMYNVEAIDPYPGMLNFKQYITKTHIISQDDNVLYSPLYSNINVNENAILTAAELLYNRILQVHEYKFNETSLNSSRSNELFTNYFRGLISFLQLPHLCKSQLDEDVCVETFWSVEGYKDINPWADFQILSRMSHQIRIEKPLPPVSITIYVFHLYERDCLVEFIKNIFVNCIFMFFITNYKEFMVL